MKKEIQIFRNPEFGDVRTITVDGEPWFVGKDVANALGYSRERDAISNHVDKDDAVKHGIIDSMGREQPTTIINESGLYSLIFGSKLPSAKKFKRWVTSEVLPALRKTGGYQIPDLQNNPMKLLELHYEAIKQVDHKADMALDKTDKLEERFNQFEQDLPLLPEEADSVSAEVKKRVIEILGGKSSNAYHDKSISQTAFIDAYRNLKRNFNVRSYKCIKRNQIDTALRIAMEYEPPVYLEDKIRQVNDQMNLF